MKPKVRKFILDLVNAGLKGDTRTVELAALGLAQNMKKEYPDFTSHINETISAYSLSGGVSLRGVGEPVPVDYESKLEMANIASPDTEANPLPVLTTGVRNLVSQFLEERTKSELLLAQNIRPSTSILLIGEPGTGKTMLARHIASVLNKELIILDLSSSVSSLMGKTGANLKRVIQYAKKHSSVLLFDEFDAIAKKRDDKTDLGEIKRVVNVLLMELEDWPISSVFIATSNHPELLDRAIWRRFDHVVEISLPGKVEALSVLTKELGDFLEQHGGSSEVLMAFAELMVGKSPADMCKFSNNVKRRSVLNEENPVHAMFKELTGFNEDKKLRAQFCITAKNILGDRISIRELADITGLSPAGVQHHLKKTKV